jgi:hypothetical protein
LPISGRLASWRPPTGFDDLALAESEPGLAGAVAYATATAVDESSLPLDASDLPIGDLDRLVAARRQALLGDSLVAEGRCAVCDTAIDVHFSLGEYESHMRPRRARGVTFTGDGWWHHDRHDVSFRAPTARDVIAAVAETDPRDAVVQRCCRGAATGAAVRAVEHALTALAPTLRSEVVGRCPECGDTGTMGVDVRELCMEELRFVAAAVFDDVHLLACSYGWTEDDILRLPSTRRRRYADMLAGRSAEIFAGANVG